MSLQVHTHGPANPASLVCLIHGYGANGLDLLSLSHEWMNSLPNTLFIAPDAPEICENNPFGFQWFSIENWCEERLRSGAQSAHPILHQFIKEQMATYNVSEKDVVVCGFSQGTMMSLYTGLRQKTAFAGILGYSGALIGVEDLAALDLPKPPILLIHGEEDDVVPIELMATTYNALVDMKYDVEAQSLPQLAHSIDHRGIEAGRTFLKTVLS